MNTQKAAYIQGIYGIPVSGGQQVVVNSTGKLGVTGVSSARFKEAIKPMDKLSEGLLALQPVTFRYRHELDPDGVPRFGLVAEEVEKVNPDLVLRDADGKISSVRYEAVNARLLNEFLKEHRTVEEQACQAQEQEALIAELKANVAQQKTAFESTLAAQQKQIEALTAGMQEVRDEVRMGRVAANAQ